jgi:hypothetical protein
MISRPITSGPQRTRPLGIAGGSVIARLMRRRVRGSRETICFGRTEKKGALEQSAYFAVRE